MILLALLAASVAASPVVRLGPMTSDGHREVRIYDQAGVLATRIICLRNEWVDPEDSAARLMMSTSVAATILEKNGTLTEIEQLGPARYVCVIAPLDGRRSKDSKQ